MRSKPFSEDELPNYFCERARYTVELVTGHPDSKSIPTRDRDELLKELGQPDNDVYTNFKIETTNYLNRYHLKYGLKSGMKLKKDAFAELGKERDRIRINFDKTLQDYADAASLDFRSLKHKVYEAAKTTIIKTPAKNRVLTDEGFDSCYVHAIKEFRKAIERIKHNKQLPKAAQKKVEEQDAIYVLNTMIAETLHYSSSGDNGGTFEYRWGPDTVTGSFESNN
jgi:hypothetical protein